ncbi:putative DNA repair protein Mms21 [Vairimorpha necatrix]|uniref:DNA repair protein Mms21 n=1 Tax=Vairimorpha necatrix TaxID=6039 RepID=A0AAX4JF80_9MICR
MDEYISRKKDLLEDLKKLFYKNNGVKEMISLHKEILNNKESILKVSNLKRYQEKLEELANCADECEVKLVEREQICPFQQKKVVNAFTNHCGHTYERKGLENFLKNNNYKCPAVGCNSTVKLK